MSRAVSFDLDGVVMENPFESCVLPRVRQLIRNGSRLAGVEPREADRLIDAACLAEWTARMERGETVAAFDWDSIYNQVSRGFGGPPVPDVTGLVEECCTPDCITLLPGVHEGIGLLHRAGYRAIALTNGYSHYQAPVLKALGVSQLFDQLVAPDNVNLTKPDPGIFRAVPGLVAHVGDTLYADVLGARLAGLTTIWLSGELPEELRGVPAAERPRHPAFEGLLALRLAGDPHRAWHADTALEHLACDAVAQDVAEAAEAVIEILGASVR
jgi:putative hydrolase of the HAD superfamily